MPFDRRNFLQLAATALAAPAMPQAASTQTYPARPVRLIVPFPAGGALDVTARTIAQHVSDRWSQRVFVENLPTGASNVGTATAARAPADGHTLLVVSGSFVVNPSIYTRIPWNPVRDFVPISLLATSGHILAIHPSIPANSVKELVALIKADPRKYNYASPGTGTTGQMCAELFKLSLGLDLLHVPFNGAPPAITSTIGGYTPILFAALPAVVPAIKGGQLRGLAVTSGKRSTVVPDVPTMAEAGFPDQESLFPQGIVAPAGTPPDIIDLWHREIRRIFALPDVTERLVTMGFEPLASTPEEFGAWIAAEIPRWAKVVREANIARIE
jgi:tripartite-type tricarboxylate transporter receptor subunit TctC